MYCPGKELAGRKEGIFLHLFQTFLFGTGRTRTVFGPACLRICSGDCKADEGIGSKHFGYRKGLKKTGAQVCFSLVLLYTVVQVPLEACKWDVFPFQVSCMLPAKCRATSKWASDSKSARLALCCICLPLPHADDCFQHLSCLQHAGG